MPSWRRILEAVTEAWTEKRDEIRAGSRARRRAAPGRRGARALGARRSTRASSTRPLPTLRASYDPVHGGFGGAPKFPAASAIEFLLRRGETEMTAHTLRGDGLGRDVRPDRRRLRPLLGGRALARPPLREDALRQRAARPRLPARLAGDGRRRCSGASSRRRSTGRCARCAATRAASTRRSTPTPRARRASSTSGRSTSCAVRRRGRRGTSARPRRATSRASNILVARRRGRAPELKRAALRGPLAARVAGAGRQAADVVERADDRRAGRGGRGARARRLPRRRARLRGLHPRASCATTTAGCCAPGRTARRS